MIPRAALWLGLAGLLPFLWGALGVVIPALSDLGVELLGQRFNARSILVGYGTVIMCFMSGVLWGFATRAERALPYVMSTAPALWGFFMIGGGEVRAISAVLIGFILVFLCDLQFAVWRLVPEWWIRLRALLSVIVAGCLLVGMVL